MYLVVLWTTMSAPNLRCAALHTDFKKVNSCWDYSSTKTEQNHREIAPNEAQNTHIEYYRLFRVFLETIQ
jgi:hypothetical protein